MCDIEPDTVKEIVEENERLIKHNHYLAERVSQLEYDLAHLKRLYVEGDTFPSH